MLGLRIRVQNRKAPIRRFAPTNPTNRGNSWLEIRSLAVPAFWMQPAPPIPNDAFAGVTGTGFLADGTTNATVATAPNPGLNAESESATLDNYVPPFGPMNMFPGVDFQMTGLSSSKVNDLPNPGNGSGAANVFNTAVSATTSSTISWLITRSPSSPVVNNTMTTGEGWSRAYFLADTDSAPAGTPPGTWDSYSTTPEYLHESYSISVNPLAANTGMVLVGGAGINSGPTLNADGVPTGGLALTSADGAGGLAVPGVTFEGLPVHMTVNPVTGTSATGSLVNPTTGDAVSVDWTPLSITASTSVGVASLPYTTETGVVTGPTWYVTEDDGLTLSGPSSAPALSGQTSITTNYGLNFSNYPTTS